MVDTRHPHERIAAELRAEIMDDTLKGQLPNTEELKARFEDIGNATITKVLNTLKGEGLVRGVRGAGVYVVDRSESAIAAKAYVAPTDRWQYLILKVSEVTPPGDVAAALNTDVAMMRRRLGLRDGAPLEISESYFLSTVAREARLDTKRKPRGGAQAALAAIGLPHERARDTVSSRPPTTRELELLNLPPEVNVLRTLRKIWSGDQVVEVDVIYKGAHRYAQEYDVPLA